MTQNDRLTELQQIVEGILGNLSSLGARLVSVEERMKVAESYLYGSGIAITSTFQMIEGNCPVKHITITGKDGVWNCPDGCNIKGTKECPLSNA